jgi:hypothetical protein
MYDISTLATVIEMIDNRIKQLENKPGNEKALHELEALRDHLQSGIEVQLDALEMAMGE